MLFIGGSPMMTGLRDYFPRRLGTLVNHDDAGDDHLFEHFDFEFFDLIHFLSPCYV